MITVYPDIEKPSSTPVAYGQPCVKEHIARNPEVPTCLAGIDLHKIDAGNTVEQPASPAFNLLTYIIDGILDYRDDSAERRLLMGGEVQIIDSDASESHRAGNASHSEPLHLMQVWMSSQTDNDTCYQQRYFPDDAKLDQFCLIASQDGREGSLKLTQDANVYASLLQHEDPVMFQRKPSRVIWLRVARGRLRVNDTDLAAGDIATIFGDKDTNIRFRTDSETEFLLLDLPRTEA